MSGPEVWGPHGWKFIHYITLGYPYNPSNDIKKQYLDFFTTLQYVIPCSICGNNFKNHMIEFPLTNEILSDKKEFINWGIKMHNLVNITKTKKTKELSYKEGYNNIIKSFTGDCPGYTDIRLSEKETFTSTNNTLSLTNIILIIIIVILIFIIMKCQNIYIKK